MPYLGPATMRPLDKRDVNPWTPLEPAQVDISELTSRIRKLPQELIDLIQDDFFATIPKTTAINSSYKPPAQLQINRQTRRAFASSYYRTTTFYATTFDEALLIKWLASITPKFYIFALRNPAIPNSALRTFAVRHFALRKIELHTTKGSYSIVLRLAGRSELVRLRQRVYPELGVDLEGRLWLRYSDGRTETLKTCLQWSAYGRPENLFLM